MKKILTCVAMALLLVGCAKEYNDSGLRELISALDTRITALESNVQALQSAIGEGVFVAKVQEYVDPDTGKTIGVTVTYTNGDVKYFEITPKADYDGPVLGVIKNGAGQLVWAIDGVAIMVDDEYVTVYQTPVFSIDDDGNLWVSIDGQDPVNLGPVTSGGATLEDGIFTDIKVLDDKIVLTLSDNSTVSIPFAEAFKLNIDASEVAYSDLKPITIPYTVSAKTANTVVDVIGYNPLDFNVEVNEENIVITPLKYDIAAKMMAYADSRIGLTSIVALCVEPEGVSIVDTPWSAEFDYVAAGEDGTVTAHVVSNVEFVAKPEQDWVHVVEVKGTLHTISIVLDDNPTLEEREGDVTIYKKDDQSATGIMQIITILQGPGSSETGPANLSKKQSANSYLVYAPGEYKFAALKGYSEESVGTIAKVEVLWETVNTDVVPAVGSIVASVAYADGFITFATPDVLTPGNAVIAAKDASDVILWSWHIWIPATEITTNTYGIYGAPMMDRNLGALVAAPDNAEAPVESYGFFYQWGRKDPFPGPAATSGSSFAALTNDLKPTQLSGDGATEACKITLEQSIQNPLLMGRMNSKDWITPADNTLWVDEAKTMYDPCPPGYRVPARDADQPMHSSDFTAVTGWSESKDNHVFTMGDPLAVFPFAGYLDDYGPAESVAKNGLRVLYWTAHKSDDDTAYGMNVRESTAGGNAHKLSTAGKSRGGSVRCVVFDPSAVTPPTPTPGPEPGDDTIDLSKDATANCYVVGKAGDYKFKAVKGNSEESVGTVASVEILWETYNNDVEVTANSVIAEASYEDGYVKFSTPETLQPGNAAIAVKDASDVILWSWHIWIPETMFTADTFGVSSKAILSRNLGALVDAVIPAEGTVDIRSAGLYYQWGRKDPFVGYKWGKANTEVKVAGKNGRNMEKATAAITVAESIAAPTTIVAFKGDWVSTTDNTLWGLDGDKTIYDPCPAGYRVPAYNTEDPMWQKVVDLEGFEANADAHAWKLGTTVFNMAGFYDYDGGISHPYDRTFYWSNKNNANEAYGETQYLYYEDAWKSEPGWGKRKACALPIRCIAE